METYGSEVLGTFLSESDKLKELAYTDYTEDDIRKIVSFLGGKLELFLKTIVFPSVSSREGLNDFISRSKGSGLSMTGYNHLDRFRLLYNRAKHEPSVALGLVDSIKILEDANTALKELVNLDHGRTSVGVKPQSKRLFWLSAWDNFIGGITTIHVIIPVVSEHWLGPPTMDTIYISISDWDQLKTDLLATGGLYSGYDVIPDEQVELFKADDDFLDAFAFEGEYRELLLILSKFERQQSKHPHLHREHSGYSTLLVLLLALIDVLPTCKASDLSKEIKIHAVNFYGMSAQNQELDKRIELLVDMVSSVPEPNRQGVSGPLWLGPERFNEELQSAVARHYELPIIITKSLAVAMEWKT